MSLKRKLYKLFPFIPATNLFIGRKIHDINVNFNRKKTRRSFVNKTNLYVNAGCGGAGLAENWVNIDYSQYEHVNCVFDCRKDFPFADNSVKAVYTEHFFEHLDYLNEVPYFLKNCYRIMQENGVLRIIIPDAEKYLLAYCQDGWDGLKKTRPLDDNLNDTLMGGHYDTKMQLINEVFRQGGEHKYAWDFETIKLSLLNAGFTKVYKMSYMKSYDQKLEIDQLVRKPESLYVEAIK